MQTKGLGHLGNNWNPKDEIYPEAVSVANPNLSGTIKQSLVENDCGGSSISEKYSELQGLTSALNEDPVGDE